MFDHVITIWAPIGPYEIGNKSRPILLQPMCTTDFVTYQYSMPRPSAKNHEKMDKVCNVSKIYKKKKNSRLKAKAYYIDRLRNQ